MDEIAILAAAGVGPVGHVIAQAFEEFGVERLRGEAERGSSQQRQGQLIVGDAGRHPSSQHAAAPVGFRQRLVNHYGLIVVLGREQVASVFVGDDIPDVFAHTLG